MNFMSKLPHIVPRLLLSSVSFEDQLKEKPI